MWRRTIAISLIILVALAFAGSPVSSSADSANSVFAPDRILVKFKAGVPAARAAQVHQQLGGRVKATIPGIDVLVVNVPQGQVVAKVKAYRSHPLVEYAEPDFVVRALVTPDDPYFSLQRGLTKVQAPEAWDVTVGSARINIAILDTGVDLDHPDLASKLVAIKNLTGSSTADDVHGHGTHVAGIAAATTDNGIGVAGLGYSASIMNVKVLGDDGSGSWSWVAQGIIWATDNGADVINMSLGGSSGSSTVESAINYAWSKGVVVVAAAGNSASSAPFYPAYYTNCMAVAATDSLDNLASWSNYGDWVDVAAPGVSIYSTLKDGAYGYKSGTSMASPHVAGLAALVFAVASDSNGNGRLNDEVRARIESTCDDIGISGIGFGRINAYKAVAGGGASTPPLPPPPPTTGSITGKVTDAANGSPIGGATITCGEASVITSLNGDFTIGNLPQGTYVVAASATNYVAASRTVEVVAGQVSTANFALDKLPPPPPRDMWVESISFRMTGKSLRVDVKVVSESQAVAGAQIAVQLTNALQNWNFTGTTDTAGLVSFAVNKAPAGSYVALVTDLTATGYVWNTTRGVTSATYTLNNGSRK